MTKSSYQLKCSLWPLLHKFTCPRKVKYEKNNSEQLCFVTAAHQEQSKRIVHYLCCLRPQDFLSLIFNCFEVASCLREVSQEPTFHFVLRESIDHDMIDQEICKYNTFYRKDRVTFSDWAGNVWKCFLLRPLFQTKQEFQVLKNLQSSKLYSVPWLS